MFVVTQMRHGRTLDRRSAALRKTNPFQAKITQKQRGRRDPRRGSGRMIEVI